MYSPRHISKDHIDLFTSLENSYNSLEWYYNMLPKAFPLEYYIHWQQVLASILYLSFTNQDLFMPFYTYSYLTLEKAYEASKNSISTLIQEHHLFLKQLESYNCTCLPPEHVFLNSTILDEIFLDSEYSSLLDDALYYGVWRSRHEFVYSDLADSQDSLFDFFNRGPHRRSKILFGDYVPLYGSRFDMSHIGIHTADRIGALYEDLVNIDNPPAHVSAFSMYLLTGNAYIVSIADSFSAYSESAFMTKAMEACWRLFVEFWTDTNAKDIPHLTNLLDVINENFEKIFNKAAGTLIKEKDVFYIPIQDFLSRHDSSSAVVRRILRYLVLVNRNPLYVDVGLHFPAIFAYYQLLCDDFGLVNNRDVHFDTFYSRPTFCYSLDEVHWIYSYFVDKLLYEEDMVRAHILFSSTVESISTARASSDIIWDSFTKDISLDNYNSFLLNYLRINSRDSFDFMCNLLMFFGKH